MDEALLRYVTGALSQEDDDTFAARLFDDPILVADAARMMRVIDALTTMAAEGPLVPVVVAAELQALRTKHVVSDYTAQNNMILSRIESEDFVAAHIPLSTSRARIDVIFSTRDGVPYFRVCDAPFDPASGEVIILCERHVALATGKLHVRIVDEDDTSLAEVTIEDVVSAPHE